MYRFLATGDDTNGKYALWEAIVPPGGGPPPHVHSREKESVYILEGEIKLQIGDKVIVAALAITYPMRIEFPGASTETACERIANVLLTP